MPTVASKLTQEQCTSSQHAPLVESQGVVHANVLDGLDLEAGLLDLFDVPVKRRRRSRARKDITVHQEPPRHVLVVSALAEAGHLWSVTSW